MPRFEPFRGIRYDEERFDLADVTAPPYDVLSDGDRDALAARHARNVVGIDVPRPGDGLDRYGHAARLLRQWLADGTLLHDHDPAFYVYRMGYVDEAGRAHQTAGVIGALEVVDPGAGGVLPHEQTTPKARTDRLDLTRATQANLSPVWGLSLASGLSALCELPGPPLARWTDAAGVHHRLYGIDEPGLLATIGEAVASAPVLIADGHHRYEIARQYAAERRATDGAGPWDLTLALVVELAPEQLHVQAIHRLLAGIPADTDLLGHLARSFEPAGTVTVTPAITDRLDAEGVLCLLAPDGTGTLLRPRAGAFDGVRDLDTARLDHALLGFPTDVSFQHGVERVLAAVGDGSAQWGVLLRPVPLAAIEAIAHEGALMPPKSTFFAPKPATGTVIRPLW